MKISIVTPTFNRTTYLNQTIESVLSQKGDFEIEYIVQDGGSGEELIGILEQWKRKLEEGKVEIGCNGVEFNYFVEKDSGMYDAINRGFAKCTGEVMAWINSDDMYHPYAFTTVTQVFGAFDNVFWITGIPNSYNLYGSRSGFDTFPQSYSRKFLAEGFYDVRFLEYGFNWIQQESTFWRRGLWNKIGGKLDTRYRYAADFYLWQSFAAHADLVRVESFLGGYRSHEDQITADPDIYNNELPERNEPPAGLRRLNRLLKKMPVCSKLFFNKRKGYPWLGMLGLKFEDLTGRSVVWSFREKAWKIVWKAIV